MKWFKCTLLTAILFGISIVSCSVKNILIIDGTSSPSHQIWMHSLGRGVANRGHNVTFLSCKMMEDPPRTLHNYHLHNMYDVPVDESGEEVNYLEYSSLTTWQTYTIFGEYLEYFESIAPSGKGFLEIMDFPKEFKFDLIIYDNIGPKVLLGLADRFPGASLVSASAYPNIEYTNGVTRGPNFPAFVPNMYVKELKDTFCSRLENFLIYIANDFLSRYYWYPRADKYLSKTYQTKRSLKEIASSTKIHLVNYSPAMDYLTPIMPGVIPVGGLQIAEGKPLPKDLEDIFALPSKGVILFALGTNVKSEMLGEHRLKDILSALGELSDYTFIWKIDLSKLKLNIPKNVFIKNWLPQNDILADNRTRLFISHAGGLSTQEATWHGQPMLALPIMFDQFPNSAKVVENGMAIRLDVLTIDKDTFKSTLLELLNNKKYSDAAKLRSKNFRDQKETPLERAIWWVEYVMRNPDVSFLRSQKLEELNYFVKHSIDIIAFLTIILLLVILMVMKCICCITRKRNKNRKMKVN